GVHLTAGDPDLGVVRVLQMGEVGAAGVDPGRDVVVVEPVGHHQLQVRHDRAVADREAARGDLDAAAVDGPGQLRADGGVGVAGAVGALVVDQVHPAVLAPQPGQLLGDGEP